MGIYLKGQDLYPALISREGGKYLARFVDIPNCLAFGNSAIEAEINAAQALAAHFRFLGDHGSVLPSPSLIRDRNQGRDGYIVYINSSVDHDTVVPPTAPVPLAA